MSDGINDMIRNRRFKELAVRIHSATAEDLVEISSAIAYEYDRMNAEEREEAERFWQAQYLEQDMRDAVAEERYEDAARIRDEIAVLKPGSVI
jgi:excinuclease UvrABC helicase subunit UvrB